MLMASKEELKDKLENLEGIAVADASRIENSVLTALNAVASILDAPTPAVPETFDPGFDKVQAQTQAVADGGQPNVHPLSGEPVPPGSTEGVRPDGTTKLSSQGPANLPAAAADPNSNVVNGETGETVLAVNDPAAVEHPEQAAGSSETSELQA
jgi:hypothetical protein